MIGIVVPAHNEEQCLEACLLTLKAAAAHPALKQEPVMAVVVLDACEDGSAGIAARHVSNTLVCLTVAARNVGMARHAGASYLLDLQARWLAFTDADSRVAPSWLADQLAEGADAVCGLVTVDDWSEHAPGTAECHARRYQRRRGHRHVHGANMGVAAHAYLRAGGFPASPLSEDVGLVQRLIDTGATVAWSDVPQVVTSGRKVSRVRGGFADHLRSLVAEPWLPLAGGPAASSVGLTAGPGVGSAIELPVELPVDLPVDLPVAPPSVPSGAQSRDREVPRDAAPHRVAAPPAGQGLTLPLREGLS